MKREVSKDAAQKSGSDSSGYSDDDRRILQFLEATATPGADVEQENLKYIRSFLERAVLIREYDRVDAATLDGRVVSVDHVLEVRGSQITGFESFYHGQCFRITFNEDSNDYVDAYLNLDLAYAAASSNGVG